MEPRVCPRTGCVSQGCVSQGCVSQGCVSRIPETIEIRACERGHEPRSCDFGSSSNLWGMLSGIGGIFWNGCENVQPIRVIELPGGGDEADNAALLEDHARRVPDDKVCASLIAILKENPQVLVEHQVVPTSLPQCYRIDGREVHLELVPGDSYLRASGLGGQVSIGPNSPVLVCQDSVMRQPFLDYVFNTGYNEWYEDLPGVSTRLETPCIFKEFPEAPPGSPMDRFDAMKLAHQQALERERTSIYTFGVPKPVMVSQQQAVELPNFLPTAGGA